MEAIRISFGYSTYSDPTSSTQGNLIVCTKSLKKRFCLTLINPDSKQEQTIAQTPVINGYSWSPKGRYVISSKDTIEDTIEHCMVQKGLISRTRKGKQNMSKCG